MINDTPIKAENWLEKGKQYTSPRYTGECINMYTQSIIYGVLYASLLQINNLLNKYIFIDFQQ